MLADKIIRNKIKDKIPDKKVRNVFYVTAGIDGKSVYAICGNNNKVFGCAIVSSILEKKEIIIWLI